MVTEADALLLTLPLCSIHLCAFETHNARRHSEVRDVRIADVIKFENDGSTMVFRHPSEDFNTLSQLIVHESQEAVLFRDGQALDLFRAGRHTLTTQNIPLLGKLVNLPFDGVSPFHCEVYFINRTTTLDSSWGVGNIDVIEPEYGLKITLGASGTFGFKVIDSRKLLVKLVGTDATLSNERFARYFKDLVAMRVRRHLYELAMSFGYFALSAHQDELSQAVRESLTSELMDYGAEVTNFYIGSIGTNEDDFSKLKAVREKKLEFSELSYNWVDEQIRDIALTYAGNPGTQDNIGNAISQMPLALSFGAMIAKEAQPLLDRASFSNKPCAFDSNSASEKPSSAATQTPPSDSPLAVAATCASCGHPLPQQSKFCPECGRPLGSTCRTCGKSLGVDMKFCPECGTPR